MSTRVSVDLTVLLSQKEAAIAIFGKDEFDDAWLVENRQCLTFHEISNGQLRFLPKLEAAGIAYDAVCEASSEWSSCHDSCRFTPEGESITKELSEAYNNPSMHELMQLLDKPDVLITYIKDHAEKRFVLPWDNQEQYGKLYRTRQLIGA